MSQVLLFNTSERISDMRKMRKCAFEDLYSETAILMVKEEGSFTIYIHRQCHFSSIGFL